MTKKDESSIADKRSKQGSLSEEKKVSGQASTNVVYVDFSQLGKQRRRRQSIQAKIVRQNTAPAPLLDW